MGEPTKHNALYIIGNGFDLHHELDTRYSSFGCFLKQNHPDIFDFFVEYCGFDYLVGCDSQSLEDSMWWNFESNLSYIHGDLLLENYMDFVPKYASDDFRDRDRYDISILIEQKIDEATSGMREAFEEFISQVCYISTPQNKLLNIDTSALFLSFNYTDTLERYYKIPREHIDYIHNKAGEGEELILGHGINPVEIEQQEEQPPENQEEYELWKEKRAEQYDYSIERGKDEIRDYYRKSFKATNDVIAKNLSFFEKMKHMDKIYVLGHSLSDVDLPYFRKLKEYLNGEEEWVVSYFKVCEIYKRKAVVQSLGVPENKIHMIKLDEL
jgi:hypothetical protein